VTKPLNELMEFDSVIRVTENGDAYQVLDVYGPEVYPAYNEDGSDYVSDGWELLRGYTGQYGCAGSAHMHNSEYIGGGMERDILETPGYYCAGVLEWPCDAEYGCDGPDAVTGQQCDMDHSEGWAVAYRETL
jgi:hypothetical protein